MSRSSFAAVVGSVVAAAMLSAGAARIAAQDPPPPPKNPPPPGWIDPRNPPKEDPKIFTAPWRISMILYRHREPSAQILEYECYGFDNEFHAPVPSN